MRGFLLTLDALLALSLVGLAFSFFALDTFSAGPAGSAMFLAGRDYLAAGPAAQADVERALLAKGWRVSSSPQPSRFSVHVRQVLHPRLCAGVVSFDAPCLRQPDAWLAVRDAQAWVGVP